MGAVIGKQDPAEIVHGMEWNSGEQAFSGVVIEPDGQYPEQN